jgi:hypothetical protein
LGHPLPICQNHRRCFSVTPISVTVIPISVTVIPFSFAAVPVSVAVVIVVISIIIVIIPIIIVVIPIFRRIREARHGRNLIFIGETRFPRGLAHTARVGALARRDIATRTTGVVEQLRSINHNDTAKLRVGLPAYFGRLSVICLVGISVDVIRIKVVFFGTECDLLNRSLTG